MELSGEAAPSAHTQLQESLQPTQAVAVLNERVKHISKVNVDIADFLQVHIPASPHPALSRTLTAALRSAAASRMHIHKHCASSPAGRCRMEAPTSGTSLLPSLLRRRAC